MFCRYPDGRKEGKNWETCAFLRYFQRLREEIFKES